MNKSALISIAGLSFLLVVGCGTPNLSGAAPAIGSGTTTGSGALTSSSNDSTDSGAVQGSSSTHNITSQTSSTPSISNTEKQQHINLSVLPSGKLGPDGKKHDAFSPSDFTVVEGIPVTVTIYNFNDMQHSLTSTSLGLNIQATPAQQDGNPGVTTITFTPTKAGDFQWRCIDPCDLENNQWAMSQNGYMMGSITVSTSANSAQTTQTSGPNSTTANGNGYGYGGMMGGSSGMMNGQYGGVMGSSSSGSGMGSMMGGGQ